MSTCIVSVGDKHSVNLASTSSSPTASTGETHYPRFQVLPSVEPSNMPGRTESGSTSSPQTLSVEGETHHPVIPYTRDLHSSAVQALFILTFMHSYNIHATLGAHVQRGLQYLLCVSVHR